MNEKLKKVDAVVRCVDEYRPNMQTIETNEYEIAKKLWYDHDEYYLGVKRKLIDITVNGVTFTDAELRA